jgi:hypothetical protein
MIFPFLEKNPIVFFGPIKETIPIRNDMFAITKKLLFKNSITLVAKQPMLIIIRITPILVSLSFKNIYTFIIISIYFIFMGFWGFGVLGF